MQPQRRAAHSGVAWRGGDATRWLSTAHRTGKRASIRHHSTAHRTRQGRARSPIQVPPLSYYSVPRGAGLNRVSTHLARVGGAPLDGRRPLSVAARDHAARPTALDTVTRASQYHGRYHGRCRGTRSSIRPLVCVYA
eukprot:2050416-Rhodomonas_salina.2